MLESTLELVEVNVKLQGVRNDTERFCVFFFFDIFGIFVKRMCIRLDRLIATMLKQDLSM